MSREIKFRAWDGKKMRMSLPFGFADLYGYEGEVNAVLLHHPYGNEGQQEIGLSIVEHRGGSPWYPQLPNQDPVLTFLQYTGLKDRNGVEIYEGDLLNVSGEEGAWETRFGEFSIEGRAYMSQIASGWYVRQRKVTLPIRDIPTLFEVAGNIYENPELLDHE